MTRVKNGEGDDKDELFGSSATEPFLLPSDDGEDDVADPKIASTGNKRSCSTNSKCCNDFEKIFEVINGKKVRIKAKCIHCGTFYSSRSSGGTGHLLLHIEKCQAKEAKFRVSQSLLQFKVDGSVHH